MGAPKKYENDTTTTSVYLEVEVLEFYQRTKIPMGVALREYMEAHKPRDISAADYALQKLLEQKDRKIRRITERDATLHEQDQDEIAEIEAEITLLQNQKASDHRAIQKMWPMFRATKKQMIRPPETWKGDMDVHRWWGEQGVDMTYDTVYRVWDEMEGSS